MPLRWARRAAGTAKYLVPPILFFFVGRAIVRNWDQVREADWRLSAGPLLLSFVLCAAWYAVRPWGWNVILNRFGRPVPFAAVFRVTRQAELSRYIPGGVWQFLSRIYLIKRWGVSASACLAATLVDLVLATLASLIPASWTLADTFEGFSAYHRVALVAFPALSILIVHPRLLNGWAGFLSARLGRPWTRLHISYRALLGVWGVYVGGWLMTAAGAALFVRGVLPEEGGDPVFIGSAYCLAWLIGTLAMIAPGGMGIREGALGLLLGRIMQPGPAFTLAVAIRLWMLLVELGVLALGSLLPRPEPPQAEENEPSVLAGARD